MLINQGVELKDVIDFAWTCLETENKTMDSVPPIPSFIYKKSHKPDAQKDRKTISRVVAFENDQ